MSEERTKGYRGEALETLVRLGIGVWDDVLLQTTRGEFRGIVLPRSEFDDSVHLVLKLPTGYNTGIDVRTIVRATVHGTKEAHYKIPENLRKEVGQKILGEVDSIIKRTS